MLTKSIPIPKKLHFIWMGKPIPPEYFHSIKNLAGLAKKSGFEIFLWIDKEMNYTKTSINEEVHIPNLKIKTFKELEANMKADYFYQHGSLKKIMSCMQREQVGNKNLASASDILRCVILRQEGGYYFDTDTKFIIDENSLLVADQTEWGMKLNARVMRDPKTQKCTLLGNNDIEGFVENHPALNEFLLNVIKSYASLDNFIEEPNYTSMDAKRSYQHLPRSDYTSKTTGPIQLFSAVSHFIENKTNEKNIECQRNQDKLVIAGIHVHPELQQTWLRHPGKQKAYELQSIPNTLFPNSTKTETSTHHTSTSGTSASEVGCQDATIRMQKKRRIV